MRVAVLQVNSRADRDVNLATAHELLQKAADAGADLAVLPEYLDYLGPREHEPKPELVDGEFATAFADAARRLRMWVVAGSFHECGPDSSRTYNTSLVFDRDGVLAATYRKIHMFDINIPDRVTYQESRGVAPGTDLVTVDIDGVRVGLSICYDLRFPELYRQLAVSGAQVLLVPAAFTTHTGRDHWEVLLRARAIENQCYVIAAAQSGDHSSGRLLGEEHVGGSSGRLGEALDMSCYGHSMVVDPWGTVIAQAVDGVGMVVADLDFDRLARIRQDVPSLANRRL